MIFAAILVVLPTDVMSQDIYQQSIKKCFREGTSALLFSFYKLTLFTGKLSDSKNIFSPYTLAFEVSVSFALFFVI